MFESTFFSDDAHVDCIENLISAGVDAIISGFDTNLIASVDTANAAGVYYVVALGHVSDEDFAGNDPGPFFLGGTQQFGGDLAGLGRTFAEAVLATDAEIIGGVSFPAWAFTDAPPIYAGFQEALTATGRTVADLEFSTGFMPDDVQSATQAAIHATPGMQAIFGMASGLDFVFPVLHGTDIRLISLGYNESVPSLLESGAVIAAGNNNHTQSIASAVVRIINALDGNQFPDAASGEFNLGGIINGVASYPVVANAEQLADYLAFVIGDASQGPVTVEELKSFILSINPDATLAGLNALTNRTVDEIRTAR